jgi:hypothetical protein
VKQKSFGQSIILDDKQFEIRHQKMRTYKIMNSSALSDMNEKENVLLAQMESADEVVFY